MFQTSPRRFRREDVQILADEFIGKYIGRTDEKKIGINKIGFKKLSYTDATSGDDKDIPLAAIFERDLVRMQNLFSLLDDCIAYGIRRYGPIPAMRNFWPRFKISNSFSDKTNEGGADLADITNLNLTYFDQVLRLIFRILGAEDYLNEKERESNSGPKKYTLGRLLTDDDIDSQIDGGKGKFKDSRLMRSNETTHHTTLFFEILKERNKTVHHDGSVTVVPMDEEEILEECRKKSAFILVAFLHIVDFHYDALEKFFADNFPYPQEILPQDKKLEFTPFDPEVLKSNHVIALRSDAEAALRKNVGAIVEAGNKEGLKLMNLKMQLVWKDEAPVYYEEKTDNDTDDAARDIVLFDLKHVPDMDDRVNIILGHPGSGKSTLLSQLQKVLCTRWEEDGKVNELPVFLALKGVRRDNFDDAVHAVIGDRLFSVLEPMAKEGKVVFILDGLNELALDNPSNFLNSLCSAIWSEYSGCRFYLTGRVHEFDDFADLFQSRPCSIYQMRDISRDEIKKYFKELKTSEATASTFLDWTESAKLDHLLSSPLNFSMIAKMVLMEDDSRRNIESIANRGELLDLFLKSTLQDTGEVENKVSEAFVLLQHFSVALDKANRPLSVSALAASCEKLYPYLNPAEREDRIRDLLDEAVRLNVLSQVTDSEGTAYYSFNIDTFQEFFLARNIAVSFSGNLLKGEKGKTLEACLPPEFNFSDTRRFEMLRMALQLIAGGRIQADTAQSDSLRFTDEVLRLLPDNLVTLAALTADLPETSEARKSIEQLILGQMVAYRETHADPDPEADKAVLLNLAKSAATLSSDALYDELFNLYWGSLFGVVASWEFGFSFRLSAQSLSQYRTALVSHCTAPQKFYDRLHDVCLDVLRLYPVSTSFLNSTRNHLFTELTTYRQQGLYEHILQRYKASKADTRSCPDHLLSQDASLLLLYIDDPEFIYQNMNLKEMKEAGVRIGFQAIKKLLRNYRHPLVPKIIFQQEFFDLIETDSKIKEQQERQRNFRTAMIIRYFLFRNARPQELLDYLSPSKGNGLERLNETEKRPVLDMLPVQELRPFAPQYYDPDIFRYLDEYDDEEESEEGLHYRLYAVEDRQVRVWIRNIDTPLAGCTAVIGQSLAPIQEDTHVMSRQYRFKFSCPTIINKSGTMMVLDQSYRYVVPFAGSEVVFTTFDERLAARLMEAGAIRIGESQVCTVEKTFESPLKTWRILTLGITDDLPYSGNMQFVRDGAGFNIDKTIQSEGYRFDPQLYRRTENLPLQHCSEVPYTLLGMSHAKVWVVTDKLMNYDRYRDAEAVVRPIGQKEAVCRFLEAHAFTEGFVELTFRSAIPFVFPESGELFFDLNGEDSVPYVFCYGSGTRSIVRIIDRVFVQDISDPERRHLYMKGSFRIGNISLSLDYVELFPGSERLSVWTMQRLADEVFPHEGHLEVAENPGFKKLFQLSFTSETRRESSELEGCRCLSVDKDSRTALFSMPAPATPVPYGLYLANDRHAVHLKILETRSGGWTAQAHCVPHFIIPEKGFIRLPGADKACHYLTTGKEGSGNILAFFPADGEDFAALEQVWNGADLIEFIAENGEATKTGFRQKEVLKRDASSLFLKTDLPGHYEPSAEDEGWYLTCFFPIRNEMERTYDPVLKTIKVHKIPYMKVSETRIRFRKPVTDISGLWVGCNDSSVMTPIVEVDADSDNSFHLEYCTVELVNKTNKPLEIAPKGEVRFFAREAERFEPVSVGYSRVLAVIDLMSPQSYPSQICDIVIRELSEMDVINLELVRLFSFHSRSYMLFEDTDLLRKVQAMSADKPMFNIGTVTSIDKDGGISAFSWLRRNPFPSMDLTDHLSKGDLVLIERNHKITRIDHEAAIGSLFPPVGELTSDRSDTEHEPEMARTSWKEEVIRIRQFKERVSLIDQFRLQKNGQQEFMVHLPDEGLHCDTNGIAVICDDLPQISFRLRGVSEDSYKILTKGGRIGILPSERLKHTFNPYKFTYQGFLSVIDTKTADLNCKENYHCIVFSTRNEKIISVFIGNSLGTLEKKDDDLRPGDLVRLHLNRIAKNGNNTLNMFTRIRENDLNVGRLNLKEGDVLDDIPVISNGKDSSYIEVEYEIQGKAVRGSIDTSIIPHFPSRMVNGIYSPGKRLKVQVAEINKTTNRIRFKLRDKSVVCPFGPGVYEGVLHRGLPAFKWWFDRGYAAAWVTFRTEDRTCLAEIPDEEMLRYLSGKSTNIFDSLLTCDQELPVRIEITGFTPDGDPVVHLQSLNDARLQDIPAEEPFSARILFIDVSNRTAVWQFHDLFGTASFQKRPALDSFCNIVVHEADGERKFQVQDSTPRNDIVPGDILTVLWQEHSDYIDKEIQYADILAINGAEGVHGRIPCRSGTAVSPYMTEYFASLGQPLKVRVDGCENGIYALSFIREFDYNWNGIVWKKNEILAATVAAHTENYIIVRLDREDGSPVYGAIRASNPVDTKAWRSSRFPVGSQMEVKTLLWSTDTHAVYFLPTQKRQKQEFCLKENDITNWRVYDTGSRGEMYIELVGNEEIKFLLSPFDAGWSVLPSGKPLLSVGSLCSFKVSSSGSRMRLSLMTPNPWIKNKLSVREICQVVIDRVERDYVRVRLGEIFGEIPFAEFKQDFDTLSGRVGETVEARISMVSAYSRILSLTLKDLENLRTEPQGSSGVKTGDMIQAAVSDYTEDDFTVLDWESHKILLPPYQAAVIAGKPWHKDFRPEELLPRGTKCRLVVEETAEGGDIVRVKPHNPVSPAFMDGKETEALVLYADEDGVYARTDEAPENASLIFIPCEELLWGKVYSAMNFYPSGQRISVVKRSKICKPFLYTASVKRLFAKPNLTLETDSKVKITVENILPSALNVVCEGGLQLQIAVEDTTWNPSYMLGKNARLGSRFKIGDKLEAAVEEGGMDQEIRLSLRETINPWEFGQLSQGEIWPAHIRKVLDPGSFVASCRGLFVHVANKTGLQTETGMRVEIKIREIIPEELYASAELIQILEKGKETVEPMDPEEIPFKVNDRIPVRITRIHHPLLDGDQFDYLEFEPLDFRKMRGVVPTGELAWRKEDRRVDGFRVGDMMTVVILQIDFRKMQITGSLREARSKDDRSAGEIGEEEIISATIRSFEETVYKKKDGKEGTAYNIDFSHGGIPGRMTLSYSSWTAVQDPETFFRKGREMRVTVTGKGEFFDRVSRQNTEFLKLSLPFLQDIRWNTIAGLEGQIGAATIVYMQSDSLFVLFSGHFIVRMERDDLLWETALPLNERFKIGQEIPVLVKKISVKDKEIRLDTRTLRDNPYHDSLCLRVGDLCEGKVVSVGEDRFFLDVRTDEKENVTCMLPFSEFPYPWHRDYRKGETVRAVVSKIDLPAREIIVSRKNELFADDEKFIKTNGYYWFRVKELKKEGVLLDIDGYKAFMNWNDAWMDNVPDPEDMYPAGMKCLLKVKQIDKALIIAAADFEWSSGMKNIKTPSSFQGEVCLRNPANGIIMRAANSESDFCLVTRKNFSEPLMSDILSYVPGRRYPLLALYANKKVFAKFKQNPLKISEKEYEPAQPGKIVTGIVRQISDKYVVVQYDNIRILVDKRYVGHPVQFNDLLTIRITHHEHYRDSDGMFVSKKLIGSVYAVDSDPEKELPLGRQVTGQVIARGQGYDLRVDLPMKGTVIGNLFVPRGSSIYTGQKITAYVSSHNYETRSISFTLYRPDSNSLAVGSVMKVTILDADDTDVTVDASFHGNHFKLNVPKKYFFWGAESMPVFPLKKGERYNMAVTKLGKDKEPVQLTGRGLFPDYKSMVGKMVRGRIIGHDEQKNCCIVMAGTTIGILPDYEMSYQVCSLWELLFPIGHSFDFVVCPENELYPGMAIYSFRETYKDPFLSFHPKSLYQKSFMGTIVRATKDKAVARLASGAEVLIPDMKAFSDGFQTVIPQAGTNVPLEITKVERIRGKLNIEVRVLTKPHH